MLQSLPVRNTEGPNTPTRLVLGRESSSVPFEVQHLSSTVPGKTPCWQSQRAPCHDAVPRPHPLTWALFALLYPDTNAIFETSDGFSATTASWSLSSGESPGPAARQTFDDRLDRVIGGGLTALSASDANAQHAQSQSQSGSTREAPARAAQREQNSVHPISHGDIRPPMPAPATRIAGRRTTKTPYPQRTRKNTKTTIKVAALNIKGNGNLNINHPDNKWNDIGRVMNDTKTDILIVGEAHLNQQRLEEINKLHSTNLHIEYSENPHSPNAKGVAVVFRRLTTNVENLYVKEVIAGQALLIRSTWHGEETLTILAIYAPNDSRNANEEFWKELSRFFTDNPREPKPDIMLGDCNVVESPIDRLPSRADHEGAVEALDNLKLQLRLKDGWRDTFPNEIRYTYEHQANRGRTQSRIDRIYATQKILDNSFEWEIKEPGMNTDHKLVSVRVTCESAPWQGAGRWVMPEFLLREKEFLDFVRNEGLDTINEIERTIQSDAPEDYKIQKLYAKWKDRILNKARTMAKQMVPKIKEEIAKLELARDEILNDNQLPEEERRDRAADFSHAIRTLSQKAFKQRKTYSALKYKIHGETMSKEWTRLGKVRKPKDCIRALQKLDQPSSGEPEYEKNSKRMAELGRDYHEKIQYNEAVTHPEERERATRRVLSKIDPDQKLNDDQSVKMGEQITLLEIRESLTLSHNGKAPGLDGIPYEFWKILMESFETATDEEKSKSFDVLKLLKYTYNDIQTNGLDPESKLAEGWMCPLYKKNDRTKIENYRPITLLNTDYKILTKVLSIRLAELAQQMIHKNQAGFVPGRSIYDHVQLAKTIINYGEVTETNGVIVALDQEKAYDKIAHDYLWKVLAEFNIPDTIIKMIRGLYENANTQVMINGYLSSPFRVIRGVRQGDPLSCLLFDLAIEPLAAELRKSQLKGIDIPNSPTQERLICTLFADDTTVYLSDKDSLRYLKSITDVWCMAARAKFNDKKMEIIPFGSTKYRRDVLENQSVGGEITMETIPDGIRIARDGETTRILGGHVGNNINNETPWIPILNDIDKRLERWEKTRPTMEGRRLIILMVVGGKTQYLAKVQGMPKSIEKRLEKRIRNFIWGEKWPTVNEDKLRTPIDEGGLNLLDIVARNEAISVIWLKTYLNFGPERATWASFADAIIESYIPDHGADIAESARMNIFLQSWTTLVTKLPTYLREMIEVARKYGLRMEGIAFSREIISSMPIWYHQHADPKLRSNCNVREAHCMRGIHKVKTVNDTEILSRKLRSTHHKARRNCACESCRTNREKGCQNPHKCYMHATKLLKFLPEKWNPLKLQPEDIEHNLEPQDPNPDQSPQYESKEFDRRITTRGNLADAFRIFTKGKTTHLLPELDRNDAGKEGISEGNQVYTSGACNHEHEDNAQGAAATWRKEDDPRNEQIKIPTPKNELRASKQSSDLVAIKAAIESSTENEPLLIRSGSKSACDILTQNLQDAEDRGFIDIKDARTVKATVARLRERKARTFIFHVTKDSRTQEDKRVEKEAEKGLEKDETDEVDFHVPPQYKISGAKLKNITQSIATKAIQIKKLRRIKKKHRKKLERRATSANLDRARHAIRNHTGIFPTDSAIWKSLRCRDFSIKVRYFMWMMMHDAYKVGDYWQGKGDTEIRERCHRCGVTETLEHILLECDAPGQKETWELVEELWNRRRDTPAWKSLSLGSILGCGLAKWSNNERKPDQGRTRFYKILVSEAAYMIWKLRNERVIQNGGDFEHTKNEIRNRLISALNTRLTFDRLQTNHKKWDHKAIPTDIVLDTWRGSLHDEENLPENWIRESGVLVGILPDG